MANHSVPCPHCGYINWKYGKVMKAVYLTILDLESSEFTVRQVASRMGKKVDLTRQAMCRLKEIGMLKRVRKQPMGDVAGAEVVYTLTIRGVKAPLTL